MSLPNLQICTLHQRRYLNFLILKNFGLRIITMRYLCLGVRCLSLLSEKVDSIQQLGSLQLCKSIGWQGDCNSEQEYSQIPPKGTQPSFSPLSFICLQPLLVNIQEQFTRQNFQYLQCFVQGKAIKEVDGYFFDWHLLLIEYERRDNILYENLLNQRYICSNSK